MQTESTGMAWGPGGRRTGSVESALLRLFRLPEIESDERGDSQEHLAEWNRRLAGQRSRIARRLSLIDEHLGLSEPRPVLSVVGSN